MPEAEDKKISQLVEKLYSTLLDVWEFVLADSSNSTNYRISVAEMKKFILGVVSGGTVRPIGTNIAGALLTTDGVQDVSNKNLQEISVNGASLDDSVTGTQLSLLKNLNFNVKSVFDGLNTRVSDIESRGSSRASILSTRYCFNDMFTTPDTVSDKTYPVADILEKCEIVGYRIPYGKCQVQLWQNNDSEPLDFILASHIVEEIIMTTDIGGINLSSITLKNLPDKTTYNIVVSFNVALV